MLRLFNAHSLAYAYAPILVVPEHRQKGSIGLSGQLHTLQDAGVIDHLLLEKAAKKRVTVNYPEISQGGAECRLIVGYGGGPRRTAPSLTA